MRDPIKDSGPVMVGKMKITKTERNKRQELTRAPRPKTAATIVLTCGPKDNPKILMGQRSARHDFMPSVYVFPGGRVDRADSFAPYAGDLSPRSARILEAAYSPRRARAMALAAIRETWEETGLMLGAPAPQTRNINHPSYDAFRAEGLLPDLSGTEVFGRAITPPHRHKRFDTWFFIKHLGNTAPPATSDSAELQGVGWFTWEQIAELELQRATQMMLDVLRGYLKHTKPPADIFYSRAKYGRYEMPRFPLPSAAQ
jgi:8-oxo-dGTP pyrophosphatase MutT (NUDIX family)